MSFDFIYYGLQSNLHVRPLYQNTKTSPIKSPYTLFQNGGQFIILFYMHVNYPSLPHFRLKILLYYARADEAKRANLHGYKRIKKGMPFWTKVYSRTLLVSDRDHFQH